MSRQDSRCFFEIYEIDCEVIECLCLLLQDLRGIMSRNRIASEILNRGTTLWPSLDIARGRSYISLLNRFLDTLNVFKYGFATVQSIDSSNTDNHGPERSEKAGGRTTWYRR
jgi:hypothetical protein